MAEKNHPQRQKISADMQQLLPLTLPASDEAEHYIITDSNRIAYKAIMHHHWEMPFMLLFGEASSGKTTLAHHAATQRGGNLLDTNLPETAIAAISDGLYIIDDVHHCDAEALFHALNMIKSKNAFLLMTAAGHFSALPFTLPDTVSRLRTAMQCHLQPPDDEMMMMLLHKQLSARQLHYDEKLLHYVLPRLERSYSAISDFAAAIDTLSLRKKQPVTIPLAREVLESTI